MIEVYMNKSSKLVQGIGTKGTEYPTWDGKKILKEYAVWGSMLHRCTEKVWATRPSYIGTTCSDNFKSYSFFYEWCQTQVGFSEKDNHGKYWHLDKDLLVKGNKVYSENVCVFLPADINQLFTKRDRNRGDYPLGVSKHKRDKTYSATCNCGKDNQIFLGNYSTPLEAFLAYKKAKEAYIKQVAEQYKDVIDPRAYKALLEYEVNIDD